MMNSITPDLLRRKASEKIREIATELYTVHTDDYSIMYGKTGIALFLFYYWRWKKQNSFYKKAAMLISEVFVELSKQIHLYKNEPADVDLSFSNGLCGIGWCINHLIENNFIECDIQDTMCMIDAAIYRKMTNDLHAENRADFMDAMAISVYAAGRTDRLSKEYLRRFVKEWIELENCPEKAFFHRFIVNNKERITCIWDKIIEKHPDIISVSNISCVAEKPSLYTGFDIHKMKDSISILAIDSGLAKGLTSTGYKANKAYRITGNQVFMGIAETCFGKLLENTTDSGFWYTASRGLWRSHNGLANGLAGIGLALLVFVTGEDTIWDECLLTL